MVSRGKTGERHDTEINWQLVARVNIIIPSTASKACKTVCSICSGVHPTQTWSMEIKKKKKEKLPREHMCWCRKLQLLPVEEFRNTSIIHALVRTLPFLILTSS